MLTGRVGGEQRQYRGGVNQMRMMDHLKHQITKMSQMIQNMKMSSIDGEKRGRIREEIVVEEVLVRRHHQSFKMTACVAV